MNAPMQALHLYFAYGSNLSTEQMRERCPESQPWRTVLLMGYRLAFGSVSSYRKGGVATILPYGVRSIPIVPWLYCRARGQRKFAPDRELAMVLGQTQPHQMFQAWEQPLILVCLQPDFFLGSKLFPFLPTNSKSPHLQF